MNAAIAPSSYGTHDSSSRVKGIVIVVVLHVLIGYALASGMARKGLDLIKKPLEAVVIQEVIIPPPPPPPPPPKKVEQPKELPKVQAPPPPFVPPPDVPPPVTSAAPVMAATPIPPTAPTVIAPPPPPAPAAPAAAPAPVAPAKRAGLCRLSCDWTPPEVPRRAYQEGFQGRVVVKAEIFLKNNVIEDSKILSGPKVFYANVKNAISQSKCHYEEPEVKFEMEFVFKFEDESSPAPQKSTESRSTSYKCSVP